MNNNLPDLPSALIRLALADLREVEKLSDVYVVNMSAWHSPNGAGDGRCEVCLAGAVLARTLGFSPEDHMITNLHRISNQTRRKMSALNAFRTGLVFDAMQIMLENSREYQDNEELFEGMHTDVPEYSEKTREAFHAAMARMADELEKLGY